MKKAEVKRLRLRPNQNASCVLSKTNAGKKALARQISSPFSLAFFSLATPLGTSPIAALAADREPVQTL